MTYTEYITAVASRFGAIDADVQVILANQATLIPDATAQVDVKTAKLALCRDFANIIPMASSISEGGYSISWNMEALRLWYSATCRELGITDATKPKVRATGRRW